MVTGRAKRLKELEIGDFESKSVGRLKGEIYQDSVIALQIK